jgi:uncharacterized protein
MNLKREELISKTEIFVKTVLGSEGSGHDWWHIHRVRTMALAIAKAEGADLFVVELAALLHDIDDWKLVEEKVVNQNTESWLSECDVEPQLKAKICAVIEGVSFKGANVRTLTEDPECAVVQDADRLDAMGAIGIARTFAYGGSRGRRIYDPGIPPVLHTDFEDYKRSNAPTINHFYEKLLLLKDQMQTKTGRALAGQRHEFMCHFLNQFYAEWNGNIF